MLTVLLLVVAGVSQQLPHAERYIDQCQAAYFKHSDKAIPADVNTISVWMGQRGSSVAFTFGNYGEVTGVPSDEYGVFFSCLIDNDSLEVAILSLKQEMKYYAFSTDAPELAPDMETEFAVIQYAITASGRKYLGVKRFSQRGLSVYVDRVRPSDAILHGYHSLPGLDELPPAHAQMKLPAVEASRYQDNDDGTVTDKITGLMWQRCASGRQWREGECQGEALVVPYADAEVQVKWANHNNVAGYNDWRLPQIEELAGLVYCSSGQRNRIYPSGYGGECLGDYQVPTLMLEAFDKDVAWGGKQLMPFWSSSMWRNSEGMYWSVFFDTGFIADSSAKLDSGAIRLVREVKK